MGKNRVSTATFVHVPIIRNIKVLVYTRNKSNYLDVSSDN
jgi:hypothetical protein